MNTKLIVWIMAALAVCAVVALLILPAAGTTGATASFPASKQVSGPELRDLVAKGARLVDVRTAPEFAAGHIASAENLPIDLLPAQAKWWDKSKAVVVYCATGARSLNAYQYLVAQGFQHVFDLTQGVAVYDGKLTKDAAVAQTGAGAGTSGGKPVLIEFYTDS
jgi:rhodanese-related sulfurtransferase